MLLVQLEVPSANSLHWLLNHLLYISSMLGTVLGTLVSLPTVHAVPSKAKAIVQTASSAWTILGSSIKLGEPGLELINFALPEFVIPAGKVDEFKAGFSKFYAATKNGPGAAGCLYYGFGFAGDSMYCRVGYKTAEDCAKHGADVKEMIEEPIKAVGAGNFKLNVVGPAAELEKLKPKLAPRGAIFWELDSGSMWL